MKFKHLLLWSASIITLLVTIGCNSPESSPTGTQTPSITERPHQQRIIELQGANNFRDMGGYITDNGMQVRYGLLYRSGQLSGLTEQDQQHLAQLGLHSICDFRTAEERQQNPSQISEGINLLADCNGNPATNLMQVSELMKDKGINNVDWHQFMVDAYRNIALEYTDQYRAMFQALTQSQQLPMLFHCTAGKDRTGFGAALVLLALGVPEETVYIDYELTNQFPTAIPDAYEPIKQAAPALFEARKEFLDTALQAVKEQYGSVDNYLHNGLGLSEYELQTIRKKFLQTL